MTKQSVVTAALFAACATAGCISAQVAPAADPAGCWYFEHDAAAAALNLPWGIRLGGDALEGFASLEQRGEPRVARTLDSDRERDQPFGYWMAIAGDSVQVGYPAGGGLVLRLARGETAMTGVARPAGDAVAPGAPPRTNTPVRLTRAQCPTY